MQLIDRSGSRVRVQCDQCAALVEVRTQREKKYGAVCRDCLDETLAMIVANYRDQMERLDGEAPSLHSAAASSIGFGDSR